MRAPRRCGKRPYLDYAATCPVDPRVLRAMRPWWGGANPASDHPEGESSREAVAAARRVIARLLGAKPREVVFCSGATEADNLALLGYAEAVAHPHIVTCATEHKAVLASAERAQRFAAVDVLPVSSEGLVDPDLVAKVAHEGSLVSVMAVNNETGVCQPLEAISGVCRRVGALLHVDAAQALGRFPLSVGGYDMMSLSAHKAYGPKGMGALWIREGVLVEPQIVGGRQEHHMRAGTGNTPAVVGFARAAQLACAPLEKETERLARLNRRLVEELGGRISGQNAPRVPGIVSLRFPGIDNDRLLSLVCDTICCSAGSACSADGRSHVMRAMGIDDAVLRVSLGRYTTNSDISVAVERIQSAARHLEARPLSVRRRAS